MVLFRRVIDIKTFLEKKRYEGIISAFVPTMGALHDGHISLLNIAKKDNLFTICSIFVNPTQFNNQQDFSRYPKTIENDINLLENMGCDLLFLPSPEEIYPNGQLLHTHYELGELENILEGKFRPGHFQGVCQVVDRLLDIIGPNTLYLGQKDYQQCMVIKKLIDAKHAGTVLKICPTQREISGLAMSSRNMLLNEDEKKQAVKIYETLQFIKQALKPGDLIQLKKTATERLSANGFVTDYVEVAHADTLSLVDNWNGDIPLVALIATFLHEVRLIDNLLITN